MIGLSVKSTGQSSSEATAYLDDSNKITPVKFFRNVLSEPSIEEQGDDSTSAQEIKNTYELPVPVTNDIVVADSRPIQIWEGTVKTVDHQAESMNVTLEAKWLPMPRHSAEISLEWVSEQDKELVISGAVFYLSLFKRTKRGSVQNSQELRFRRRPSWSSLQLKRINEQAIKLHDKMKALPSAE